MAEELTAEAVYVAPRPIKTPRQGSYGMKHVVERAIGRYMANGELIAAALMAGYPTGPVEGPNTVFGMEPAGREPRPRRHRA